LRRLAFVVALTLVAAMAVIIIVPRASTPARAADFDGDGFDDLAVGAPFKDVVAPEDDAGAVSVLYSADDGTGLSGASSDLWHQEISGAEGDGAQSGDHYGAALAWGDFDADGFDDLAIGIPGEDVITGGAFININSDAGAVHVLYGTENGLTTGDDQFWHQAVSGVASDASDNEFFGAALAGGDFDSDGYDDLAIGTPGEDTLVLLLDAGAANVLYGSASGLTSAGDDFFTQNSGSIPSGAGLSEGFGSSLAAGDFDGNGIADDLVIGVPLEGIGGELGGAINVLYGTGGGLSTSGSQFFHQDSPGIEDTPEDFEGFGDSLATGDFDGDGDSDLAVGVPLEDVTALSQGAVHVLFSSGGTLSGTGSQFWHQGVSTADGDVAGAPEAQDQFGAALASGDFDAGSPDDLAIGVPWEDGVAGAVNVLYGSKGGLSVVGNQVWSQSSPATVQGTSEPGDSFGSALAAGNYGAGARDDLAIGVPSEDVLMPDDAIGAVNVLYGRNAGLRTTGNQLWHLESPGVVGDSAVADLWGGTLA
jgi:hypothetical protein